MSVCSLRQAVNHGTDENFNKERMGLLDSIFVNKQAMMQRSKLRI